jgi:hypothetical protein
VFTGTVEIPIEDLNGRYFFQDEIPVEGATTVVLFLLYKVYPIIPAPNNPRNPNKGFFIVIPELPAKFLACLLLTP